MKGVLLFFLMIVAAVVLGLVIAYFYLRRLAHKNDRRPRQPRVVPLPAKHPPVDVTPTSSELPEQRSDATGTPDGADIDGLMRRLAATTAKQEQRPARDRDDLKRISGIGPKLEQLLNANGIFLFRQIADWQDSDIEAIDQLLPAFHGRIQREDWVGQARTLRDDE